MPPIQAVRVSFLPCSLFLWSLPLSPLTGPSQAQAVREKRVMTPLYPNSLMMGIRLCMAL